MKMIGNSFFITHVILFSMAFSATGQGVFNNYSASWVGNSFGRGDGKWVQNYINEITVAADGTVYTKSHWDEGGRRNGVYKDGDVIGNQSVTINGKSVVIDGKTWTISGTSINGPDGKVITDVVKPTSLAKDNENRLMVTEEGPRQQLLFYDVSGEPILVEAFGVEGGIGAHLSIGYGVSDKYPAGEYPRGIYHPYKLWGMTGCGMDDRGRIFISTSQNGTVLRAFEKNNDGEWMLDWELFGLFFVDAMDVDPYSDGVDAYGVSEHFRMDYSKDGGKEWRLHGYTVDPVKYPDDPRLFEEIKAGHNHGLTSPFIRYLKGVKFMFVKGMYSQLNVFRFEDNGQICYHVKTLPSSFSWWIDQKGDYWQANGNKIEKWSFTGDFDEKGAPVHVRTNVFETDNSISGIGRLFYDETNDIIYLGAYSTSYPKSGDEWGILGRVVYRYENFTSQKKLTTGYPLVLAYNIPSAVHQRVFAKDFAIAGDKLFIIWFIRGPYYLEQGYVDDRMRGEISVYKSSTGDYQGAIIPTALIGGPEKVGWVDIPNSAVAFERANGEIVLFVEEDGFGKNILYRICESGNCENNGYILLESPKMNSRFLPDDEIIIKTDYSISEGVSKVEFYADETLIGEVASPPFNFTWSTSIEKQYSISSRAYTPDNHIIQSSNSPSIQVYTPRVDSLVINPREITIQVTDSVVFACKSFDQFHYPIEATITWEVLGNGAITNEGVFTPAETGTFAIVARHGDVSDTVSVFVYEPELNQLKIHPANPMLYTGKELQLQTHAVDQFGNPIMADIAWTLLAGDGTLLDTGAFIAGNSPGQSLVIATSEEKSDTVEIRIVQPSGWVSHDIGAVGSAGSADIDPENDLFVVRATGSDIWGNSDQFHYLYKPLAGDGSVMARVDGFNITDNWAKVGLMIRKSNTATSSHVSVVVTGKNGIVCQFRSADGGNSTNVPSEIAGADQPYWLRLDRSGHDFFVSASSDGVIWNEFYTIKVNMPDTVLIGLAATSHNNSELLTATFSNVVSFGIDPVRVEGIELNKKEISLPIGQTEQLLASLKPNNPIINTTAWKSLAPTIATVNQQGVVTAVNPGETFIVVTATDGNHADTCLVVVYDPNVAIHDTDNLLGINIYPNPANDGRFTVSGLRSGDIVRVYDLNGKMILARYVDSDAVVLDMNPWKGLFVVSVFSQDVYSRYKIVIE
jgi:regulation of enolase protein 1 (concanavalin A-like superfamily)